MFKKLSPMALQHWHRSTVRASSIMAATNLDKKFLDDYDALCSLESWLYSEISTRLNKDTKKKKSRKG